MSFYYLFFQPGHAFGHPQTGLQAAAGMPLAAWQYFYDFAYLNKLTAQLQFK